jgi:hypothetical protein
MVDDFKFPSEITPLGENPNRFLDTQRSPSTSHRQINLRLGEIVKGLIVDVISPKQAIISLPNGTFTAEIQGNFRRGDELFFRVHSLEPALVLKIYSVFAKTQNEEVPTYEILRILDLPSNKVFAKVIDYMKSQGNVIIRDETLQFVSFMDTILKSNPKIDLDTLMNSIKFAFLLKIEPTELFYEIYRSLKTLPSLLDFALSRIVDNAELFPRDVREKLLQLRTSIFRAGNFPLSARLLSPNFYTNEGNLFNIFSKIFADRDLLSLPPNLGIPFDEIVQGYESLLVVNSLLSASNLNYLLFLFPFIYAGNYRFVYTRTRFRKTKYEKNQKLFEFEDEELIHPIKETVEEDLHSFFSDEQNISIAEEYAISCGKLVRKVSDKIVVKLTDNQVFTFKLLPREPDSNRKVSIVI